MITEYQNYIFPKEMPYEEKYKRLLQMTLYYQDRCKEQTGQIADLEQRLATVVGQLAVSQAENIIFSGVEGSDRE